MPYLVFLSCSICCYYLILDKNMCIHTSGSGKRESMAFRMVHSLIKSHQDKGKKRTSLQTPADSSVFQYAATLPHTHNHLRSTNIFSNSHHQSFIRLDDCRFDDDCHVAPTLISFLKLLGSGAFFARRPSNVALSRLSSKAPLLLTWRFAAAATAGECCP